MRTLLAMTLIAFLFLGCSSRKKEKQDSGLVFAERIFDVFKDFTKKHQNSDATSEIVVNRTSLPQPFRMAVTFMPPEGKNENWSWTRKEKDQLISSLEKDKRTSRVFELIHTSGKSADLSGLRLMAAQQGADAILLVRGAAQVVSQVNALAATYIALVPMLFVEGNEVRSTFITQAVLWDVRRPYVHLGVETEGDWKMDRPLAFRQQERAVRKSREEALQNLQSKLQNELAHTKI